MISWFQNVLLANISNEVVSLFHYTPAYLTTTLDPKMPWTLGRRENVFFFAGDLGSPPGVPSAGPHTTDWDDPPDQRHAWYSMGVRQRVFMSLGNRSAEGFVVVGHVSDFVESMQKSTFCGVFPGGRGVQYKFNELPVDPTRAVDWKRRLVSFQPLNLI
jgi:hypothetical protein